MKVFKYLCNQNKDEFIKTIEMKSVKILVV